MNAHELKDELLAVAALIQSRKSLSPDENKCTAQQKEEALVVNLASKIQSSLVCSLAEATTLYDTLQGCVMEGQYKNKLRDSIDAALSASPTSTMAVSVKPQKLVHLHHYLTQGDWDVLQSQEATYIAKCKCIATRWVTLGIRSLGEQTSKNGCAVLLCQYAKIPDHSLISQMVSDLKNSFHSLKGHGVNDLPYVKDFPEFPDKLPEVLYKTVYSKDKPVPKEFEQLTSIARHIPLRSTSKLLNPKAVSVTNTSEHKVQVQQTQGNHMHSEMFGTMMMNHFGQMLNAFRQGLNLPGASGTASSSNELGIKLSPSKQKALEDTVPKARKPLPIDNAEGSQEPAQTNPPLPTVALNDQGNNNDNTKSQSAEAFEEATFKALKARKNKKEDTDDAQSIKDGKGKEKKKPMVKNASAKTGVKKRPAAHITPAEPPQEQGESSDYTIPPLTESDLRLARNVYVSRHYSKARAYARKVLGMADDEAKVYGRKFHSKSGSIWDAARKKLSV